MRKLTGMAISWEILKCTNINYNPSLPSIWNSKCASTLSVVLLPFNFWTKGWVQPWIDYRSRKKTGWLLWYQEEEKVYKEVGSLLACSALQGNTQWHYCHYQQSVHYWWYFVRKKKNSGKRWLSFYPSVTWAVAVAHIVPKKTIETLIVDCIDRISK